MKPDVYPKFYNIIVFKDLYYYIFLLTIEGGFGKN